MRHCPTCETKYDDEIIRFCTKDGSPLVDDAKPAFTDNLPSESSDEEEDFGEDTIVRSKKPSVTPIAALPDEDEDFGEDPEASRFVIDTSEAKKPEIPPVSSVVVPPAPVQKTNIGLVVFFSVLGTLIVAVGIFAIFLMLTTGNAVDPNTNLNVNENIDSNLNENIDDNFNANDLFNVDSNFNKNTNSNVNLSTPTPTPSPSPTQSPDVNTNVNTGPQNTNISTPVPTPTLPPRPTSTPAVVPPPANTNSPVNVGAINGRALALPMPSYPPEARDARAIGRVAVLVLLDEDGRVVSARATSGHPFLRGPAEEAAMRSRFRPVSINGRIVRANGTILYNFVNN